MRQDKNKMRRYRIKQHNKEDKEKIYFTLDAMIHEVGNRKQYANK